MPQTTAEILRLIHGLVAVALALAFAADVLWHRRQVGGLARYGLVFGAASAGLGLLVAAVLRRAIFGGAAWMLLAVFLLGVAYVVAAAVAGMRHCERNGWPDAPLIRRAMRDRSAFPRPNLSHGWIAAVVTAISATAVTVLLFTFASPHLSRAVRDLLELRVGPEDLSVEPLTVAVLFGIERAVAEEVTYRLGAQNWLAGCLGLRGRAYGLAVVLTAALWTAGHLGTLEPAWVKAAQIFPLGLALGMLCRRYGVEIAILAHAFFNVLVILLSPHLVRF